MIMGDLLAALDRVAAGKVTIISSGRQRADPRLA
jgi:hypothetical protein